MNSEINRQPENPEEKEKNAGKSLVELIPEMDQESRKMLFQAFHNPKLTPDVEKQVVMKSKQDEDSGKANLFSSRDAILRALYDYTEKAKDA